MYASHVSTQIKVVCRKSPLPPDHFPLIAVDLVFNRWKLTDPHGLHGLSSSEYLGIILSWMILPSPSNKPPESPEFWARSFLFAISRPGWEGRSEFCPLNFFQVQGNCGHLSWQVRLSEHRFRRFVWSCFCWKLKLVEPVGRRLISRSWIRTRPGS